jgi:hypothetical protein
MEKYILTVSYWLGVVSAALALAGRLSNAFGYEFLYLTTRGHAIDVHSFVDAAVLFLFVAVASSGYAIFRSREQKP